MIKKLNLFISQIFLSHHLMKVENCEINATLKFQYLKFKDLFKVILSLNKEFNYTFCGNVILILQIFFCRKRSFIAFYDERKLIGIMWIYINLYEWKDRVVHLASYYIDERYRGRHMGYLLVENVLEFLHKNEKICGFAAKVDKSNLNSYHLLSKCGFELLTVNDNNYYLINRWK